MRGNACATKGQSVWIVMATMPLPSTRRIRGNIYSTDSGRQWREQRFAPGQGSVSARGVYTSHGGICCRRRFSGRTAMGARVRMLSVWNHYSHFCRRGRNQSPHEVGRHWIRLLLDPLVTKPSCHRRKPPALHAHGPPADTRAGRSPSPLCSVHGMNARQWVQCTGPMCARTFIPTRPLTADSARS